MSFAAAAGLWLGLVSIPVVILYVLKIKRHKKTVPYLKLWADLVADRQFSSLFQRLQRLLSLLLQLMIALCLVFAFASLTLSDSYLEEESVVVIVDTSASMHGRAFAAEDDQRTRFVVAVEQARALCEGRSPEDEFAILAAGSQPEVLQGFTRSTLRLREAVDRLEATRSSGDLAGAVALATDLLQDAEHPRIVVIGDAAGGAAEDLMVGNEQMRWLRSGESVDNVAIRRFQVRRNFALDTDYLLLAVANDGEHPVEIEVEITIDGTLRKIVPLTLAAGEQKSDTSELKLRGDASFAKATIVHQRPGETNASDGVDPAPVHDGLALDDVAYAAIPDTRSFRVLLVTRSDAEAEPFQAAMASLGALVDPNSRWADPIGYAELGEDAVSNVDLTLFVNWAPEVLPPSGRFLCINALPGDSGKPGGLPARPREIEESPEIRDFDEDHPLNRFLEQKAIRPLQAHPIDLTGGEVFLGTRGGPVGAVFRESTRKTVYLGLDVLSDLFFLQVAFPIVLRNVLGWMHEEESQLLEPTYAPGDVIRPRFRLADASVKVGWKHEWVDAGDRVASADSATAPNSIDGVGEATVVVRDGKFHFGATAEPGRYWVKTGDRAYRTAVNLFDASESDLRIPVAESSSGEVDIERSGFLFGRDLWPILLLVAAGLWLLEWGLYHRRLTE